MATRIFDPLTLREQRQQTLVSSWAEVTRVMGLALSEGRPCNLLLGADLLATTTLTIPAALPSFSIDGGGRYSIRIKGKFTRWCSVSAPTSIHDVDITLLDDAVVGQLFGCSPEPITLERVHVDASRGDLVDVFGLLDVYSERLLVSGCDFKEVQNIFAADGVGRRWDRAVIEDTTFLVDIDYGTPTTLGRGLTDVIFRQCEFARINSSLSVDLGVGSHQCVFQSLPGFASLTTNSTGVLGHNFFACSIGGTPFLGGADYWVGDGLVIGPDVSLSVEGLVASGLASFNTLAVVDDATIGGDLDVTGNVTVLGTTALKATSVTSFTSTSNATIGGSAFITRFLVLPSSALTVTGANQTIVPQTSSVSLSFSSATGSLSISTGGYVDGVVLLLNVAAFVSSTCTLPDSTANGVKLASVWTPTIDDTLTLKFRAGVWEEISRSAN